MRCLGIPNTAHFANITKIADAQALWHKMCAEKETTKWNPDIDEEYEDSKGNVLPRRTFEDLKKQGLL
jgi:splicing factor 3A subunit 3